MTVKKTGAAFIVVFFPLDLHVYKVLTFQNVYSILWNIELLLGFLYSLGYYKHDMIDHMKH